MEVDKNALWAKHMAEVEEADNTKGNIWLAVSLWVVSICMCCASSSRPRLPDSGLFLMIIPGLLIPYFLGKMIARVFNKPFYILGFVSVFLIAGVTERGLTKVLAGHWPRSQHVAGSDDYNADQDVAMPGAD